MKLPQGYKQTELGIIPEDWEVKTIKDISQKACYGVSAEAVSYNGQTKYIRITDIDDESHAFSPSPLTSPAFYQINHIVSDNDILIARTGASVGKSYIYDKSDGLLVYAGFLMKINVHPNDIYDLNIYYNSDIHAQRAIATILSDMDKEIADLETRRDKYKLIKGGMMQKLLTGQIRLKSL